MYAAESAEVSARDCNGIPAGVGECDTVSENSGDDPAHPYRKAEARGRSRHSSRSFAIASAVSHADETTAIIDGIAVQNDAPILSRFDECARACESELFPTGNQHPDPTKSLEVA
jgi:hypothetical protein